MYEAMPRAAEGRCTRKVPFDDWEAAEEACQNMMDPDYWRCNGVEMMCIYRCELCARLHTSKAVHKFDDDNYRIVYRDPNHVSSFKKRAEEKKVAVSYSRYKALYAGLNSAAKKVYNAVPMQEQWTIAQVLAELTRLGSHVDYRVVEGCLETLVKAKLVRQVSRDLVQREPVRGLVEKEQEAIAAAAMAETEQEPEAEPEPVEQPTTHQQENGIMAKITEAAAQPVDKVLNPLDRLGMLAERVATKAQELQELASELSDAAVDIQAQIDANEANVAKLRQLQQLLKSLELTS